MTSDLHTLTTVERYADCSRRQFLGGALAATAAGSLLGASATLAEEGPSAPKRKIKIGLVGCGGRGSWIASLFQKHGGYQIHAVADYFAPVAEKCGDALGVDKKRRFSGLSGYKKVIESGVEAAVLIVPPGFIPEHASAAAEAGLHVYMAKPVAVDVPGCRRIETAGKLATQNRRAFLVDYQIPTDPGNIEVVKRVRQGAIGPLAKIMTVGTSGGHIDPPPTGNIESRLQDGIWNYDIALGGSWGVSYDIHAIDAAVWLLGKTPVAAVGDSRRCRPNPNGSSHDVCSAVFHYADGLIHEHSGQSLPTGYHNELSCTALGTHGYAVLNYGGKARCQPRKEEPFTEEVVDLYPAGAMRNIAVFYDDITRQRFENPTAKRAVDGCLTCILEREAGFRHGRLTMEELLKENRRYEMDLHGLRV